VAKTSEVLEQLIVEMDAGGLSQGDSECGLEKALGQFVLSKSAGSEITGIVTEEDEAVRSRKPIFRPKTCGARLRTAKAGAWLPQSKDFPSSV